MNIRYATTVALISIFAMVSLVVITLILTNTH